MKLRVGTGVEARPVENMPSLDGLIESLSTWRGRRALVIPTTGRSGKPLGNNGDFLMQEVFHRILSALDIQAVGDARDAEVVLVPPNGALLETYAFPDLLAERISGLTRLPLVVFPSSALFPNRDPAFMFAGRRAPTLWILRERYSFEHLDQQWGTSLHDSGVKLILDHDVVASGHAYVPSIIGGSAEPRTALIAGRVDVEATSISGPRLTPSTDGGPGGLQLAARRVPYGPHLTAATRLARRSKLRLAASALLSDLPAELREEVDAAVGRSHARFVDASATQYATFREYRSLIRDAGIVVTNRLHVALPAVALGKRVIIVEAGYHKLQGVYERSLAGVGNVSFVNPHSREST
jgi:hypothetical protein